MDNPPELKSLKLALSPLLSKMLTELTTETRSGKWVPSIPEYVLAPSPESQGYIACQLWKEQLARYAEMAAESSAIVYTGIGGAVSGKVESNGVSHFGDGSIVYPRVELEKTGEEVPKVVFAVASVLRSDDLTNLITAAYGYKREGAELVIPIFTAFPHERQDHKFKAKSGVAINQLTTLEGVAITLAGAQRCGVIDGGMTIGDHSKRQVEETAGWGFPLIPIDTFEFMVARAEMDKIAKPFVIGVDKGRYDINLRLASRLGCYHASAQKDREREKFNDPVVEIPQEVLDFIKETDSTVVGVDDEVREAGTVLATRKAINGYASSFVFAALKTVMAPAANGKDNAIERLGRKLDPGFSCESFYFANAVKPLMPTDPINHKITWLDMGPDIEAMVKYMANNLDKPEGVEGTGYYPGSLFRADLHLETYP